MANGYSHRVGIKCEAEGFPAHGEARPAIIEMDFGRVEADRVLVCTSLRIDGQCFEGRRTHYGLDILIFADGLNHLLAQTQGSARLNDWDGEAVLCLTVIDHRRGRVAIGGQLIPAVFWTEAASEDCLLTPRLFGTAGGIRISFEGLVTDQSYLPPVAAGLRRFLSETGISVRSPME